MNAFAMCALISIRDIQREADMTLLMPKNVSNWLSLVTIVGMPPRDPNDDDDDENEDEEGDTEPDDDLDLAVIREPDE
jgi:hypothetical protein